MSIRQWDTDWMDQFKSIFPTNFSNLQIHPGDPLSWINKIAVPFGNKQAQRAIRNPDQRVQIAKEVEYKDKYAARLPQVVDMPAIFDSLRIDEEYYAGDVVNAVGHVSDLFQNFNDALAQYVYVGSSADPLAYGLTDQGAGTGSTTLVRPDIVADVTTAGAWTTPANMYEDFASMEGDMIDKGFHGEKVILAPSRVRPYLNAIMTSTTSPYSYWVQSIAGMPIIFSEWIDANATKDAFDIYMADRNAFDLFSTPMSVRGFFDNNTEDFVWHWKTRSYLLAKPLNDGTDWLKGLIRTVVDWDG